MVLKNYAITFVTLKHTYMRQQNVYLKTLALAAASLLLVTTSCTETTNNQDGNKSGMMPAYGDGGTGGCVKCIDNKPAATTFSTELNAIDHTIPLEQAMTMIQHFNDSKTAVVNEAFGTADVLPMYETFNLKAIDSIICQPNTIGFRIYMAMDDQQKARFVLVGVDGDGKDVIQRVNNDPANIATLSTQEVSVYVAEAGQRWPH